jgi:hypothetical protein
VGEGFIHSESVKLMRKIRLGFVGLPGFVGTESRALWVELKFEANEFNGRL